VTKKIIDYKHVDMTEEEYEYYLQLVKEFTAGTSNGKDQFKDVFDVDEDGCIMLIRPPLRKSVGWAVLVFLQNLMINQRLRRMESWVQECKS
jgi:hypothetical protein